MSLTTIETQLLADDAASLTTPFLAVLVPRGELPASLAALDARTGSALTRVVATGDFGGRKDEVVMIHPPGTIARVLLVGVGPADKLDRNGLRRAAATAAKRARAAGVPEAALLVAPEARGALAIPDVAQVVAEGIGFGTWYDDQFKRPPEEPKPPLKRVDILLGGADRTEWERGHRVGTAIAAGQALTRGLQVLPGNRCTPTFLGEQAQALASRHGFDITVMDRARIEAEGLGALLAVGKGSVQEPRFIVLEYKGAAGAPVVLVGKGITFDSGGISLKPGEKMEDMKYDMSGAAAVLGTFEMLGRLRPALHVVGLVPSAENMPSGTAYKPGDVVKSHFGKTIEVVNTDAEGRLILCDALSYARRFSPAAVLDIATLTGAVVVALGPVAAGVLGTDEALLAEVRTAGDRAGEIVWPLPLHDEYRDLIKSDIADMKNSGGRAAGTITAAWFLREFVDGFPWVHIDIAGTAYSDREEPGRVKGPTGMGMRLFSEFLLRRAT